MTASIIITAISIDGLMFLTCGPSVFGWICDKLMI
jgi:hypothetical protein